MLATSAPAPTGQRQAMEVKWDGIRAQLRFDGRTLRVRSRSGRDCTSEFPELDVIGERLGARRLILDGELVCFGADGSPDFTALRARVGRREGRVAITARRRPVKLVAFDLLHLDGAAVRQLPYVRRRELLADLALDCPALMVPRHFLDEGEALLAATAEQGLEGVVVKRLDAPYAEGRRSRSWIKIKHRRRERMVVTAWCEHPGGLPEFLLARRGGDGRLRPAGSASVGLDAEGRGLLLAALEQHAQASRGRGRHRVRWAEPVIEVLVDAHGRDDGPVRDAVLREIAWPQDEPARAVRSAR